MEPWYKVDKIWKEIATGNTCCWFLSKYDSILIGS